jgi:hypothetical protein
MRDLHKGQVSSESNYMNKMALLVRNDGLWGDFTILFWISENIWNVLFLFGINAMER